MENKIVFDTKNFEGFISDKELSGAFREVEKAHKLLNDKTGPGKDYLGWTDIPENTDEKLLDDINNTAQIFREKSDAIVIIGIGGSYLGARALIEALAPETINKEIFFAGHNICGEYMHNLLEVLKDREVSLNIISKSGTTTEPAIAFRILREFMKKKYSPDEIKKRIVCTTDAKKGSLRAFADKEGLKSFIIPDAIGGRFSVLTPVGLFPIACAGLDIKQLIAGAREERKISLELDLQKNNSYRYAACRNILYKKKKTVEILASFEARLHFVSEWWKQLFGESEGKGGKSIFPASCDFSTDLHSMGQLIQDGERNLFETFLIVDSDKIRSFIPHKEDNIDNLNYLSGKTLDFVNRKAYEATREAHYEGGVPNCTLLFPVVSEFTMGQLIYFFEKAVSISAYMKGVNPFNQPGVEAYKRKMFKLLGKP
jgi:glucose-6-phosphate isomerase